VRPLCDGERLDFEFYREAGKFSVHPTIGRIAINGQDIHQQNMDAILGGRFGFFRAGLNSRSACETLFSAATGSSNGLPIFSKTKPPQRITEDELPGDKLETSPVVCLACFTWGETCLWYWPRS
jgi:hypothetical protein